MKCIAYKINGEARLTWPVVTPASTEFVIDPETGQEVKIETPESDNLAELVAALPEGTEHLILDEAEAAAWWEEHGRTAEERLEASRPSPDHNWDAEAEVWRKVRFSKKDFLLLCGLPQIVKLNAVITAGNPVAKSVHDLLMASEFIDVTDPATAQLLSVLATAEAGEVLTADDVGRILTGAADGQV